MKHVFYFHSLRGAFVFIWLAALSGWAQNPVIWDGPTITFTQLAGVGTSVRDVLTPGVALTRDTIQGLFNAASEAAYTHFYSPADTEWSYGSINNYASLAYTDWEDWNGRHPPSMVGQPAVVHLISENIYLSLTFTSWGGSSGGGFSYTRSTPGLVPEPSALALAGLGVVCGCVQLRRKLKARAVRP